MKLVEHYIMRGTRRLVLIIVGLQKEGDAVSGGVTLRRK